MASTPTVPNDSSNRTLQDRFNQDVASVIKELLSTITAMQEVIDNHEARLLVLEP
jgi:hypothetical protein